MFKDIFYLFYRFPDYIVGVTHVVFGSDWPHPEGVAEPHQFTSTWADSRPRTPAWSCARTAGSCWFPPALTVDESLVDPAVVDLVAADRAGWTSRVSRPGRSSTHAHPPGDRRTCSFGSHAGGPSTCCGTAHQHVRANSNDVIRHEDPRPPGPGCDRRTAPRYVAACSDESVLGAAFYLTDVVDGFNASVDLPEPHTSAPVPATRWASTTAAALARLGRLDHERLGLGDLGRPDGYLERQVPR